MSLTPDQIASFNARAAAGEGPKHPGWIYYPIEGSISSGHKSAQLFLPHSHMAAISVAEAYGGFVVTGETRDSPLASLPAAQLAAEHLLLQSVAPLVEPELAALRQRAEDAELVVLGLSNSARSGLDAFAVVGRGGRELTVYDYEHYDGRTERVAIACLRVENDGSIVLTPAARAALRRAKGYDWPESSAWVAPTGSATMKDLPMKQPSPQGAES